MKLFLSALDAPMTNEIVSEIHRRGIRMKYNLISYFYARDKPIDEMELIRDRSNLLMVDSGAHSFQKGVHVDWDAYTSQYAEWIKQFDRPNVVAYFEMDVDNIIGYEKVRKLREMSIPSCSRS